MVKLITLNSGDPVTLLSNKEIPGIVGEKLSEDLSNIISQIIEEAEDKRYYEEKRFNSDMIYYEEELESFRNELTDTCNVLDSIIYEIQKNSRINKKKLIEDLQLLKNELSEYV